MLTRPRPDTKRNPCGVTAILPDLIDKTLTGTTSTDLVASPDVETNWCPGTSVKPTLKQFQFDALTQTHEDGSPTQIIDHSPAFNDANPYDLTFWAQPDQKPGLYTVTY